MRQRGAISTTMIAMLGLAVGVGGALALVAMRSKGTPDRPGSTQPPASTAGTLPREGGEPSRPRPSEPEGGCGTIDIDNPPVLALELIDDRIDFGIIKQGSQHHIDVGFENRGRSELCITKVHTGCGCLEARLVPPGKKRFAPGEKGVVRVVIDTHDREGIVQKDVNITSNDLDRPLVRIEARADVSRAVVAAPVAVRFGSVARASPTRGVVFLRSPKDDPPWEVTRIQGSWRQANGETVPYTFSVEPVEDARYHKLKVVIEHPGLMKMGHQRDPLVIETTHPERREVVIQSFIEVLQRITPKPKRAALGYVRSGGRSRVARVRLETALSDVRFAITGLRVEDIAGRALKGVVAEHQLDGQVAVVEIKYDGTPLPAGHMRAVVIVETDDTLAPEVRIPVSLNIH